MFAKISLRMWPTDALFNRLWYEMLICDDDIAYCIRQHSSTKSIMIFQKLTAAARSKQFIGLPSLFTLVALLQSKLNYVWYESMNRSFFKIMQIWWARHYSSIVCGLTNATVSSLFLCFHFFFSFFKIHKLDFEKIETKKYRRSWALGTMWQTIKNQQQFLDRFIDRKTNPVKWLLFFIHLTTDRWRYWNDDGVGGSIIPYLGLCAFIHSLAEWVT